MSPDHAHLGSHRRCPLTASLISLCLLGCPRAPVCPDGLLSKPDRAERIRGWLSGVGVETPATARICFATAGGGVLRPDGTLVLDAEGDERRSAARLAHLLLHQAERATPGEAGCLESIPGLMKQEAKARAIEEEVAGRLDVAPLAANSDALERDYRRRCGAPEDRP